MVKVKQQGGDDNNDEAGGWGGEGDGKERGMGRT